MSLAEREFSVHDGNPVELYEFRIGLVEHDYCSGDVSYVSGITNYQAYGIKRSRIEETQELNRASIKLEVPRNFPELDYFRVTPPDDVMSVTVRRVHRDDGTLATIWVGRVLSIEWGELTATINCESVATSLRRPGLRRRYIRYCPHVLYGLKCGVIAADYRLTAAIFGMVDNVITVNEVADPSYGDGYFSGGFVKWYDADGVVNSRTIAYHEGSDLTILMSTYGMSVGQTVELYPGCDHTIHDCFTKFNINHARFGGFMFIPGLNPFVIKVW